MEKAKHKKTGEIVEYETVYEKKFYSISLATAETPKPAYYERWIVSNGVRMSPQQFFQIWDNIPESEK